MSTFLKLIAAAGMLALAAGCSGSDGADGQDGQDGTDGASCTATDNGDGTYTIDCDGDVIVVSDGTDGSDGNPGASCTATDNGDGTYTIDCDGDVIVVSDGTDITDGKGFRNLELEIIEVSNNGGALAVTFTVADNGKPVTNLTMEPTRIIVNQYTPAPQTYELGVWSEDHMYERGSTTGADSRLVQWPLGTYTYTFLETIADAISNDGADASLTQQVVVRIRRFEEYNAINALYQTTGLPTTDGAVATEVSAPVGNIVNTESCNSCHGPRIGDVGHGGGYNIVEVCRNCHTRDNATRVTNGTDLMTMIHQIHSAYDHTQGGSEPGHDWSHVTFPQDTRNCAKCHSGADGDNWNDLPTIESCGSCHTEVNFATGAGHLAGIKVNSECDGCHTPANIMAKHATDNVTPNNPLTPTGTGAAAANFEYVLNSVTAVGDVATVNFSIKKDGATIDDLLATFPPTGFSGGPRFQLAYALPQDGIDEPADWNNIGEFKNQPIQHNLADVIGSATAGATTGTYDVDLTFPAGATMRAVAIEGYFTQVDFFGAGENLARHAPSVVMEVDGDDTRRAIINVSGCLDCHERLELHGGNRVLADVTDDNNPAVCVTCHNPNLSSSGNTFDYADYLDDLNNNGGANYNSSSDATVALYGDDPFTWPEATQNFKDLVHGIHSANKREFAFEHVRVRGGNAYSYDWSHVSFPGDPSNCSKCHKGDSYLPENIPAEALMSVNITGTPTNLTEALAVRDGNLNSDDEVIRPAVAACYSCHNDSLVTAHMNQNGAMLGTDRATMLSSGEATCMLCHDSNSLADVGKLHSGLNP